MPKILDCTLRDGGYYNRWDFDTNLVNAYLKAMVDFPVDVVEIGFRRLPDSDNKFKGGCAYCSDDYIRSLEVSNTLKLAVMVNAADILNFSEGLVAAIDKLFVPADKSPVKMVRLACHVDKVIEILPAIDLLNELGYKTTINIMQIAGVANNTLGNLAGECSKHALDVLYFADSLGSMTPDDVANTIRILRTEWAGELGFHAHNNMELALANSLKAIELGVEWVDSTVTGMGRGPGNARTEYLGIELEANYGRKVNSIPLLNLIDKYFSSLQMTHGWGPNPYYYMAGKYGIHPSYIQEMAGDSRYDAEDILAIVSNLRNIGGKFYSLGLLEAARNFYSLEPKGYWKPADVMRGREVLILGPGPGAKMHKAAIESYIKRRNPLVMALNTVNSIAHELIDYRLACHPVRLLADCAEHTSLLQPLITPFSMLPDSVHSALTGKVVLDFGLCISPGVFEFLETYCILPNPLVISYALAVATSGDVSRILLVGFDGYGADDPRTIEMQDLFSLYTSYKQAREVVSITPTKYKIPIQSIYSL